MFKKKSRNETKIFAPVNGEIKPVTEVPDPVFSEKMMGEGIAIIPADGNFTAPVDGEIVQIPEAKHAYGLRTNDGVEVLVHIGLETVTLKGQGFEALVNVGDKVKAGDPVIKCDLEYIKNNADHIITPIIITNTNDIKGKIVPTGEKDAKTGETIIITISNQ